MSAAPPETETLYCANHPNQPTQLRCNRCDKPICPKCIKLTPTGYRCRDCLSGQQKSFETAQSPDYIIALLSAGILSVMVSVLIYIMNLGFFTIFIGPLVGNIASRIVRWLTGKRRSKYLFLFAAAGCGLGILPALVFSLLLLVFGGGFWSLGSIVWQLVYAGLAASTCYYHLSGITIRY